MTSTNFCFMLTLMKKPTWQPASCHSLQSSILSLDVSAQYSSAPGTVACLPHVCCLPSRCASNDHGASVSACGDGTLSVKDEHNEQKLFLKCNQKKQLCIKQCVPHCTFLSNFLSLLLTCLTFIAFFRGTGL